MADRVEGEGRAGWWLPLSLAAFTLIAAGLFLVASLTDRHATLERGREQAAHAAALLARQAGQVLRIAELTTAGVAQLVEGRELAELNGPAARALAQLAVGAPEVQAIWVTDAAGRLVTSTLGGATGLALADQPYFAPLRDGAATHLSGLLHDGPIERPYIAWGRALRGPEGEFRGTVLAGITVAELVRAAAALPEQGTILQLDRADGTLMMRWPPSASDASLPGPAQDAARDWLLARHSAAGLSVIASVALDPGPLLAPFWWRLVQRGLVFGGAFAIAAFLAVAAWRDQRRQALALRAAETRGAALAGALVEREELLASVQEGEARLRLAEQAGRIGLWDWDLREGRLALIGEVFGDWGLRTRRRITARTALRGVRAEDRLGLAAALTAAVRGEAPLEAEFRLAPSRSQTQPERWIAVRAEVRRGVDGQPRRMLGIALDVTDRRQKAVALAEANATLERRVAERTGALADANARLREGEARFRGIFDATFQFIGLLSPDGTLLEANDAMLRLADAPAEEVIGRPYWDAPWWPEEAGLRAAVRDAVTQAAAGHFVRRELAMRGRDGATLAIDFSVKPVRDEDGIVSLLVPEARDVSSLKAAQAQLLEAQKMEVLGRLTGGVAHDFNNLLMTVLGNLALARKRMGEAGSPQLLRHLDAAALGAERGAQLTQRLLAFARRQDLKPCAVDLTDLLAGLGDLLSRSAGPQVHVAVLAPPGLPPALVDPHALELALMNLVVNARDAMAEGGRIAVRLDAQSAPSAEAPAALAPGAYLRIAVTDTGHGMDAATLARAVEPFFSTKGPGQGTGLGLSMVHGLALQSGGALQIASHPGQGTTATLWLPVSSEAPPTAETAAESEAPRGSGVVLLVDDEPLVLESSAALLSDLGYEVRTAESAAAALAMLRDGPLPVAVVTDHAMPGMTGAALVARLARENPGLPVILATGHAGPWPEGDGPPRLAKPYTQAQLGRALAAILERAETGP
ncbi:ATP-binding protein [Roseomonas sp. F4]